jgi:transposase-like protein
MILLHGSATKAAGIRRSHAERRTTIGIRQVRDRTNGVAQAYRALQRMTCPTLGGKSIAAASRTWAGRELLPMLRTRQMGRRGRPGSDRR